MKNYQSIVVTLCLFGIQTGAHAQTCNLDGNKETSPASEFTVNGDGTVTHHETRLMWMQCSLGQTWDIGSNACSGTASTYNWKEALAEAENFTFANYDDWRLPNIKELNSIVERNCFNPTINLNIFPITKLSVFPNDAMVMMWSSSPRTHTTVNSRAWALRFYDGSFYAYPKDGIAFVYVRLVRGQ